MQQKIQSSVEPINS